MRKLSEKILSVFLAVLMVAYLVPTSVYASAIDSISDNTENGTRSTFLNPNTNGDTEVCPIGEDISKRTETSKYIRMSDGSYYVAMYNDAVHYEDSNGEWQEIDNTLVNSSASDSDDIAGVVTNKGKHTVKFANNSNSSKLVAIKQGEYKISFSLVGANKSKAVTVTNPMPHKDSSSELEKLTVINKAISSVKYADILDNIDLEYVVIGNDLKENIIVKAQSEEYVYQFDMKLNKLIAEIQEDGTIALKDDKSGEIVYVIEHMYMFDANGEYSTKVTYTLTQIKNKEYRITVTADAEWMNDSDRSYPVTIDPSIDADGSVAIDTYVREGIPNVNYRNQVAALVGYENTNGCYYYWQMSNENLPAIPKDSIITSATISLYQTFLNSSNSIYVGAYEVTEEWEENITWNTQPLSSDIVIDYQQVGADKTNTRTTWDITKVAKIWYSGESNNGIVFKPIPDEGTAGTTSTVTFATANREGFEPIFTINYRSTVGLESYYTYQGQSIGRAGSAYIADYTSELTLLRTDISYSNASLGFDIYHVYNTMLAEKYFTGNPNSANIDDIYTMYYSKSLHGAGWKLNIQETVISKVIGGKSYMVHNDADGTEHYYPYDSSTNKYNDEDGLNSYIEGNTSELTLCYEDTGVEKKFVNGYLVEIRDSNGNIVRIYYTTSSNSTPNTNPLSNENNTISCVKVVNAGSTSEKTIATFSYDSATNLLSSITDEYGKQTTYGYTYNSTLGKYLLTSITDKDGGRASYSYENLTSANSNAKLTKAYDVTNHYGIKYSYSDSNNNITNKIRKFWECNDSATENSTGKEVEIDNTFSGKTTYTFGGADGTVSGFVNLESILDNIKVIYLFDHQGRTVNSSTTDFEENVVYNASSSEYISTDINADLSKNNNLIGKTASVDIQGINVLKNGSLEDVESNAPKNWISSSATASLSTVKARSGKHSLALTSTATNSAETNYYQTGIRIYSDVRYVVSAYVNTSDVTSITADGGVYIKMTSGSTMVTSDKLRFITDDDINGGWKLISFEYYGYNLYDQTIYLCISGVTGTVYFDDIQVSMVSDWSYMTNTSDVALADIATTNYSYIENGNMETLNYAWYNELGGYAEHVVLSSAYRRDGSYAIKLQGDPSNVRSVGQTITMNSGYSSFFFSGWAKADSVSTKNNDNRSFGVQTTLNYSNGHQEYFYFTYNSDVTEWQVAQGVITPFCGASSVSDESTLETYHNLLVNGDIYISTIDITFFYEHNANDVYLDQFSLIKVDPLVNMYDDNGKCTDSGVPGKSTTTYEYNSDYSQVTVTDDKGTQTVLTEDECKNLNSIVVGNISTSANRTNGRLTSTVTTGGIYSLVTTTEYSSDGNLILSQTDSNGSKTEYEYFDDNMLKSAENANGTVTTYSYIENSDKLLMEYISGVISIAYEYDGDLIKSYTRGGYIPGVTGKQNQTYSYTYDDFGNVLTISLGDKVLAEYTYGNFTSLGGNNHLTSIEFANGAAIYYKYDYLDRVIAISWNDKYTNMYEFQYDSNGNVIELADLLTDTTYSYEYDNIGRMVYSIITLSDGSIQYTSVGYNDDGTTSKYRYGLDGTFNVSTSYDYANNGSISGMTNVYNNGASKTDTFGYTYDSLDRLSTKAVQGLYRNLKQTYSYKNLSYDSATGEYVTSGLISSLSWAINNQTKLTYDYTYDNIGNITAIKLNNETIATYTYDAQGQILTEKLPKSGKEYVYTYDTYGNIRSVTLTTDEGVSTKTYTYGNSNWKDLLTSYDGHSITYDDSGNPLSYYNGNNYTFTWQNSGELATVLKGGVTTRYTYNANGYRTQKVYGSTTYTYYYDNSGLIRQEWGTHYMDFLYDETGMIYSMVYDGDQYYFVKNLQGDVVQIVSIWGTVVVEYEYDAWGNVISISGMYKDTLGIDNPIRYRSYYYDFETGFYYLNSRYYDPAIGRFINADDVTLIDSGDYLGFNLFAYCGNNPVMGYDPTGEWSWGKFFSGANLLAVGIGAIAIATTILTCGAAAPAMVAVAAVTVTAGALTAVNGVAEVIEAGTDYNFVRDGVMGGNEEAYETYKAVTQTVAEIGTAICGSYYAAKGGNVCFVAGTLVLTAIGHIAIEEIEKGDKVWATNPDGQQIPKQVKLSLRKFCKPLKMKLMSLFIWLQKMEKKLFAQMSTRFMFR